MSVCQSSSINVSVCQSIVFCQVRTLRNDLSEKSDRLEDSIAENERLRSEKTERDVGLQKMREKKAEK